MNRLSSVKNFPVIILEHPSSYTFYLLKWLVLLAYLKVITENAPFTNIEIQVLTAYKRYFSLAQIEAFLWSLFTVGRN